MVNLPLLLKGCSICSHDSRQRMTPRRFPPPALEMLMLEDGTSISLDTIRRRLPSPAWETLMVMDVL